MRLAMVGLGRMGANMLTRLLQGGHELVAFNRSEPPRLAAVEQGAEEAKTLDDIANLLSPRALPG